MLLLPVETPRQLSRSFLSAINIHGTAVRMEQPSSNSSLPSHHPDTCKPNLDGDAHQRCVRSDHVRFTYACLSSALVVDGVDPLLRLVQRLELHQQHRELKFWGDEDIEKALGEEADMVSAWRSISPLVRRGRLPLITCSDPLVVEIGEQRKSSLRSSLSPMVSFFRNWVGGLRQKVFRLR